MDLQRLKGIMHGARAAIHYAKRKSDMGTVSDAQQESSHACPILQMCHSVILFYIYIFPDIQVSDEVIP